MSDQEFPGKYRSGGKTYITTKEVAKQLAKLKGKDSISVSYVKKLIESGRLISHKDWTGHKIEWTEFQRFVRDDFLVEKKRGPKFKKVY